MDEALSAELRWRAAIDQHVRERLLEWVSAVDDGNTAWMRGVVQQRGWPGISLVGEEAATAALLLVQHADRDPAFQRACLDLMEEAVRSGEATASDCAYLTDRVLRAEGRPQRFGTQFRAGPEGPEPQPLENPERVDERRASVGLGPFEEYRRQIASHYPALAQQPLASCRSGPLEVRVGSFRLPGVPRLLQRAAMRRLRPRRKPLEDDVPLPWLPEGCVPCRYGPGLGATRGGRLVVCWYEATQPASEPVEVGWVQAEKRTPRLEAFEVASRPAVWVWGAERGHRMLVVLTAGGRRCVVDGTLTAPGLLRVASTLPD